MKFLLIALAVFGVAQAAVVIQPKSVQSALDEIKAAIPSERIIEIVQSCADDEEVQLIQEFLRNEFPAVIEVLRNDAELNGFFADLNAMGVSFDWWNHLLGLWGIDPIEFDSVRTKEFAPKSCGGWRGVYELIQQEVTFEDVIIVISQVYDKYPEFATVWDRICAAESTIVRLFSDPAVVVVFERLAKLGLTLNLSEIFSMDCSVGLCLKLLNTKCDV